MTMGMREYFHSLYDSISRYLELPLERTDTEEVIVDSDRVLAVEYEVLHGT